MIEPALRRARWSTSTVFFANGLGIGAWAAAIPPLKQGLALSDAQLSMALLALAGGAVFCMPLCGRVLPRLGGTGPGTRLAGLLFAIALTLPMWAGSLAWLLAAAFAMGAVNGFLDVAMNSHASAVERRWPGAIMSSFHAAFSLGGLMGTGVGAALLYVGIPSVWLLTPTAAIVLALVLGAAPGLGLGEHDKAAPAAGTEGRPARPGRALLGLAAIALLCFLVEGAMVDWSGLYMTMAGASAAGAAAGFAAFSATMVLGRLVGDRVVRRFGGPRVVAGGALLAALGLGLAIVLPHSATIMAGFALVGLGLSNVVPAVFSASGRLGNTTAGGIATVASAGYAGMLAGPPLIGAVAVASSLRGGVTLMAAAALCAALLSLLVQRPAARPA
ncbi:MAG: MFS transporter [Pseudomonadota bacterium]